MSCCEPSLPVMSCTQMILGVCKAFGVFSVLDGFCDWSSFPVVPARAGPALLAAPALEGSPEIPGTERLAAFSPGNLISNIPCVLPSHDRSQLLSLQEECTLCLGLNSLCKEKSSILSL